MLLVLHQNLSDLGLVKRIVEWQKFVWIWVSWLLLGMLTFTVIIFAFLMLDWMQMDSGESWLLATLNDALDPLRGFNSYIMPMHDKYPRTALSLAAIIKTVHSKKLHFVSLSKCMNFHNGR